MPKQQIQSLQKDIAKMQVKHGDLRWHCPDDYFKFASTSEVEPLNEIVGQPRAMEALKMGSQIESKGYNVFVTGLSGTGRMTAVERQLEQISNQCPITYDYCYVNNFKESDKPHLLKLPRGKGYEFKRTMNEAYELLESKLPKLFEEEDYQTRKAEIVAKFKDKETELIGEFDKRIEANGFVRGTLETDNGQVSPEVFPVIEDKPTRMEDLGGLIEQGKVSTEQAKALQAKYQEYHEEVVKLSHHGMQLMKNYRREIATHEKESARTFVSSVYEEINDDFASSTINLYIKELIEFSLDHIGEFRKTEEQKKKEKTRHPHKYEVNLLLDNSETDLPPVIIERYPNYTNMFGSFERNYDEKGNWRTDFTEIRAGSILRADKGYLLVNAQDLFSESGVWTKLKRVLLYGKLDIQATGSNGPAAYLKPQPIEVDVKVIIIGGQTLYRFLYDNEKGFKKIFKVNAQFDYETERDAELMAEFARFVSAICNKESLPHADPSGVGAICEWATEHAGDQERITLKFSDVADIIREAAYYHNKEGSGIYIKREDVEKACEMRELRSDLIDEKLKYQILSGSTLIDTEGSRVGQINGLSVLSTGLVSFGKPSRITAVVSVGTKGIINIEREAQMSGRIHNKGLMTITAFLQDVFAQEYPMSMEGSLAFEQNYGGIDGDSASIAEIYVLLSALSLMPVNQEIAVTGSINQLGDVQPIGGVIEKITGFYEICKERGFTGNQGVIIPYQNVQNLMLRKDLVESIKQGEFHLWEVHNISDASKILLGLPWGESYIDEDGHINYTEGSLLNIANQKLNIYRSKSKEFNTIVQPVTLVESNDNDNLHDGQSVFKEQPPTQQTEISSEEIIRSRNLHLE